MILKLYEKNKYFHFDSIKLLMKSLIQLMIDSKPKNPGLSGNCATEPALRSVVSLSRFHPHLASIAS